MLNTFACLQKVMIWPYRLSDYSPRYSALLILLQSQRLTFCSSYTPQNSSNCSLFFYLFPVAKTNFQNIVITNSLRNLMFSFGEA